MTVTGYGEPVIGLAGYARTGKDTAGQYLVAHYGFQRRSFADKLREAAYVLNPIIPWQDSRGFPHFVSLQSAVDANGWEEVKAGEGFLATLYGARPLLQRLGTEVGRNLLGENVWVDAAMAGLRGRVVFTDVRFPNEADAIARVGKVVRLVRPGTGPVNDHPSETALDDYPFDAVIEAANVPELHAAIAELAVRHGWERP